MYGDDPRLVMPSAKCNLERKFEGEAEPGAQSMEVAHTEHNNTRKYILAGVKSTIFFSFFHLLELLISLEVLIYQQSRMKHNI